MTDDQRAMYTGLCMCRNTEVTLGWSRSQLLAAINLGALSLVVTRAVPLQIVAFLILAGWASNVLWFIVVWKTWKWIEYWQSCLALIEEPLESKLITFRTFTGKTWDETNKFPSFAFLTYLLPIAFSYLWTFVFTAFRG